MSQITEGADGFLDLGEGSLTVLFQLCDLCFEALACVFDTGVH